MDTASSPLLKSPGGAFIHCFLITIGKGKEIVVATGLSRYTGVTQIVWATGSITISKWICASLKFRTNRDDVGSSFQWKMDSFYENIGIRAPSRLRCDVMGDAKANRERYAMESHGCDRRILQPRGSNSIRASCFVLWHQDPSVDRRSFQNGHIKHSACRGRWIWSPDRKGSA